MSEPNVQQALQRLEQTQTMALDAVGRKAAIDDLLNKVALVQEVMQKVMHENEHYGVIPGCGTKPALLKAGAEKLGMTFRLKANFDVTERDLGNAHREYSVRCLLSDGNMGVGSCSTMESKYRYRQGERRCPECGKATIIVGKKEYGGGFLCFAKKGGCGAKFDEKDERITNQQVGKVEGDNPADFYNTALKMAKKRAHVDAIITATACSDIFTQDVEEMVQNAPAAAPEPAPEPKQAKATSAVVPPKADKPRVSIVSGEVFLPVVTVKMVHERQGTKKDGTPWTAYFVLIDAGTEEMEAATFSRTLGGIAHALSENGEQAEAKIKPGNKPGSLELVSLIPKSEKQAEEDNVRMDYPETEPIGTTP